MLHLESLLNPVGLPLGGLFLRNLAMALYIETFEITPYEEASPQVGSASYAIDAKITADALIGQLKRSFDLVGVVLEISEVEHELGNYYEIEASASDVDTEAVMRLIDMEINFPASWDQESRLELGLGSY